MLYSIGSFILDTEKEVLLLASSNEVVSSHSRVSEILSLLVGAYPKTLGKNDLTRILWPDSVVTEWALSRQISQVRQLLSTYDPDTQYIKTVHTKGFKLDVEPRVLESLYTEQNNFADTLPTKPNSLSETLKKNKLYSFPLWVTIVIPCCLLLGVFGYTYLTHWSVSYGEIFPQQTIIFPTNSTWSSSKPETIKYVDSGILIDPIGPDPLFVSTSLNKPAFYQGAVFSIKMNVNQDFVDNKGWLRLYYQTRLEGWPGEWDCGVAQSIIHTLDFEYRCVIDENGTYVKILDAEPINLGIKIHQMKPVGHAIIKSAELEIPANISTDRGWHTTNGVKLDYNRGVAYYPQSIADQLSTFIKGPAKILGNKIAFTIGISDSYKKPDVVLQLFIISKTGNWQDCFISSAEIKSNVFTTTCNFRNIENPFVLDKNERVEIGIRPNGNVVSGELKIIGISIKE